MNTRTTVEIEYDDQFLDIFEKLEQILRPYGVDISWEEYDAGESSIALHVDGELKR